MAMSDGATTTAYDIVRYPNWPNSRSNPATLGALAQLLGRPPRRPTNVASSKSLVTKA